MMTQSREQWLALGNRCFGDVLDALVAAIADQVPNDSPYTRLGGEVSLVLKPEWSGTITCYFGSKEDMKWALEFFGPPTHAVPGRSVSWHFGPRSNPALRHMTPILLETDNAA